MALIERPQKEAPPLSKKIRDAKLAEEAGGTESGWDDDLNLGDYRRKQ